MERKCLPLFVLIIALLFGPALKAQDHKTTSGGFYFETHFGVGSLGMADRINVSTIGTNPNLTEAQLDLKEINDLSLDESGFAYGLKLGNKFYFGDESSDTRFGLDMIWASLHGSYYSSNSGAVTTTLETSYTRSNLNFSIVNPGFSFAMALGDEMGLDANFNFGPNLMIDSYTITYSTSTTTTTTTNQDNENRAHASLGVRMGPQVRFHYNILAVGLEYRYATNLSNGSVIRNLRSNIFGLTIGLKV